MILALFSRFAPMLALWLPLGSRVWLSAVGFRAPVVDRLA
jgi:hypothetical protein